MRRFILLLLTALASNGFHLLAADSDVRVTSGRATPLIDLDNGRDERRYAEAMARIPKLPADPDHLSSWFYSASLAADRSRRYHVAGAIAKLQVACYPYDATSWANLACFLLKEGQAPEALNAIQRSASLRGGAAEQVGFVHAACLVAAGRADEAQSIAESVEFSDDPGRRQTYHACRAWYLAVAHSPAELVVEEIAATLAIPRGSHWRHFFARDIGFDAYRLEPGFISRVGATLSGTQPPSVCVATEPEPDEVAAIAALPTLDRFSIDHRGRLALEGISGMLLRHEYHPALEAIAAARAQGSSLLELDILEALGRGAIDDYPAALIMLRQPRHRGWPMLGAGVDAWMLLDTAKRMGWEFTDQYRMPLKNRTRPTAIVLVVLAELMQAAGRPQDSLRLMSFAEQACPTLPEIFNTRGIANSSMGESAFSTRDFQKALAIDPTFADACANLGFNCREAGQHAEALAWNAKARELGKDEPTVWLEYAMTLAAAGRLDEAVATFEKTRQRCTPPHPWCFSAAWRLSSEASKQHHFTIAEQMTRAAIALNPEVAATWIKLSGDLARQGRLQEALEACDRALVIGDDDAPDGLYAKALWLHLLGHVEAGKNVADRVDRTDWGPHSGHWFLAEAVYRAISGDIAGAQSSFDRCLALDKDGTSRRWIQLDPLLDGVRGSAWFQEVLLKRHADLF